MSAKAWQYGLTAIQRKEADVCLNCPLPECVGRRHMDCPICDPQIVINEMTLKWRAEVTSALGYLRRWARAQERAA